MKKAILTGFVFLTSIFSYSQITLENTVVSKSYIKFIKLNDNSVKYYTFNDFEMKIYNSNHSIFKTITINENDLGFSSTANIHKDLTTLVSQNVFDNDDGIEFLIFAGVSNNYTERKTFIIDDDGSIIFEKAQRPQTQDDFEDTAQTPFFIKNTETGIKMVLMDLDETKNIKYIYSLPGNAILTSAKFNRETIKLKAYPNPSSDFINLEYKLPNGVDNGKILVYNLNGKKVKEYNVDNHVNSLKLNNQDLSSGTYIYSVVAGNYKSKPLKLIIQ